MNGTTPGEVADTTGTDQAEAESASETIHVKVRVDLAHLRKWAEWHCDHNHHDVAAVLYDAIDRLETNGTADGTCTAGPRNLPPDTNEECRR